MRAPIRRLLLLVPLGLCAGAGAPPAAPRAAPTVPAVAAFQADGRMEFPTPYRDWVFLSSGLDMSYNEKLEAPAGTAEFDNIFAEPRAYAEFLRSGTWPDHTVLVMEARGGTRQGSINRHGTFQTAKLLGVEVHVKDTQRFPGGWAFFAFDGTAPAKVIPMTESCYACHRDHAAVDTTFVQFYPTLLPIAQRKGTLAPGYRP